MTFWKSLGKSLGTCALVSLAFAMPGARAQEIVVGQVAPLSGVLATTGAQMVLGGRIYFDHINSQGGVNGRKIKLLTLDDGYEPDRATANTKQLIDKDDVFALFGYVGTPTSLAALKVSNPANVPFVGAFTGAEAQRMPFNRLIFNVATDGQWLLNTVTANINPFVPGQAEGLFRQWFGLHTVIVTAAAVYALYQLYATRLSVYAIWFVAATLNSVTAGKWGAGESYFATAIAATAS